MDDRPPGYARDPLLILSRLEWQVLNQGQKIECPVLPADVGSTVHAYLEARERFFRGTSVADALSANRFTLNGQSEDGSSFLAAGDSLVFHRPPWREPDVAKPIDILYDDHGVLAVEKPAGVPVTPAGVFLENSLLHIMRRQVGLDTLAPLHRLDLETSGVLLFAKDAAARSRYQPLFQQRKVTKHYMAMIFGELVDEPRIIDIALAQGTRIHTKFRPDPEGKPAITKVLRVEPAGPGFSLVELQPITGRTHQLRAHLAAIGHAIVGDKKYYEDETLFLRWLENKDTHAFLDQWLLPRHALHHCRISLNDADGKVLIEVESRCDPRAAWFDAVHHPAPDGGSRFQSTKW